jgi:hypothetical protein
LSSLAEGPSERSLLYTQQDEATKLSCTTSEMVSFLLSTGTRFIQLTCDQLTRSKLRRPECTSRYRSHTLGSFRKRHTGYRRSWRAWPHRRDLGQLETHLHSIAPCAGQQRKLEGNPHGVWPSRTSKSGMFCLQILLVVLIETVFAHSAERKNHQACHVGIDERAHGKALFQPATVLL